MAVKTEQAAGAAAHPCLPRLPVGAKGSVRRFEGPSIAIALRVAVLG